MKKLLLLSITGMLLLAFTTSCKKETITKTVHDTLYLPAPKTTITVPMDTLHWKLIQFNTLTNASYYPTDPTKFFKSPEGVKGYCSVTRQEFGLTTAETFDLAGRTVYFKWKTSGAGQFSTVALFISRDGLIVPDNQFSNTPDRLPYYMTNLSTTTTFNGSLLIAEDTWYYSRIAVSGGNYTCTTSTSDYDDKGGTVVETKSGPLLNSAIGTIGIYDLDPYAGTSCFKVAGELIIK